MSIDKLLEPLRAEISSIQASLDRVNVAIDLLQHDLADTPDTPEPEPEQPDEPTPEPEQPEQPEPEQPNTHSAGILNTNMGGQWSKGVRLGTTRAVQISGGSQNEQAFQSGAKVRLADQEVRTVERLERTGGFFNVHLSGGSLDPDVVGAPNSLTLVSGSTEEPAPTPEQPAPEQPERPKPSPGKLPDLSFDMPIAGVNIAGPDFRPTAYWPTEEDYELAASKGIKGIRQPFRWDIVQPSLNGPVDVSQILQCLDWAAKRGQRVVIDMHDYMRRGGSKSPLIGSNEVPQSAYNDAWVKIAKEVKGHPGLAGYGLMNEPNGTGGTWHQVAQRVIDAIRTVDRQTLRFIAGDGWGNARNFPEMNPHFPLDDPDGLNVYEAHSYDNSSHSGVWEDRNEVVPANRGVDRLKPFVDWCRKHGVRGFIGEIGGFGTSQLKSEAMLTGEPAKAATESAKRALAYLAENHIPFTWWGAGGHWGNSMNAIQIGGRGANRQYREPISLITAHAGKVTRRMRPE